VTGRSGRRAWRASEEAAIALLEDMGFRVLDVHKRIIVEGVEVGEVDIVAERGGVVYAVEVKAGSADVSAVRQAYANARLLDAKPLIVARGADDKARAIAERLGVELVLLPDMLYAGFDELRQAVAEAVERALDEALSAFQACQHIRDDDLEVLQAIAGSDTIVEVAEKLGVDVDGAGRIIAGLSRRGVLPRGPYRRIRFWARMLMACKSMMGGVPRP